MKTSVPIGSMNQNNSIAICTAIAIKYIVIAIGRYNSLINTPKKNPIKE